MRASYHKLCTHETNNLKRDTEIAPFRGKLRILSRELKDMTELGLLSRKDYPVVPKKVEYSLAPRGRALLPILSEIVRWGATGAHENILGVSEQTTSAAL